MLYIRPIQIAASGSCVDQKQPPLGGPVCGKGRKAEKTGNKTNKQPKKIPTFTTSSKTLTLLRIINETLCTVKIHSTHNAARYCESVPTSLVPCNQLKKKTCLSQL